MYFSNISKMYFSTQTQNTLNRQCAWGLTRLRLNKTINSDPIIHPHKTALSNNKTVLHLIYSWQYPWVKIFQMLEGITISTSQTFTVSLRLWRWLRLWHFKPKTSNQTPTSLILPIKISILILAQVPSPIITKTAEKLKFLNNLKIFKHCHLIQYPQIFEYEPWQYESG